MRFNLKVMSVLALLAPVAAGAEEFNEDVLVPIFGIVFSVIFFGCIAGTIVAAIIVRYRISALKHKERMLAIEKGQELPVEPITRRDSAMGALRVGLLFTALGISLAIALGVVCGPTQAVWGGIPFFLGLASLVFVPLYRKFRKD
jgi:hypothetical protein